MIRYSSAPKKAARALALGAALWACGGSAHDQLRDARRELADADYAEAIAAADAGLRRTPDAKTSWGLELVRLEAHARLGHGEEAVVQLQELARAHPDRLPPGQYGATAHQLRAAGNGAAAVQVLDLGLLRHPGDPLLGHLIEASSSAPDDPAELEMLRSLGYVE